MSALAIKGHKERGKEVIEILEMLGGVNHFELDGGLIERAIGSSYYKFTDDKITIMMVERGFAPDFVLYTLEQFLEKFPYKVGDKVKVAATGKGVIIEGMSWRNGREVIYDTCYNNECVAFYSAEELQPYKEEPMEEIIKIDIPKGYEFAGVDDDNQQVVFEKIGIQYPKTYEECCDILGIGAYNSITLINITNEEIKLYVSFIRLKRCRDAYWKIAGDWKPDWCDENKLKYCIECSYGTVDRKTMTCNKNCILAFPTEEMRDAFYENFKELIEECKELL